MEKFINMFLQLFADAGTVVNTTTGDVNAYTGSANNTNAMNGELKTFYDTELLENARVELYYAQFGKKQPLPAGKGKSVEWRKWNTFAKAGKLQEAVIPTGQKFGMSVKTASIDQYGTYATVSDQLELHAYDDVILGATEEMGASAAETQETLIRGFSDNELKEVVDELYVDDAADLVEEMPANVVQRILRQATPEMRSSIHSRRHQHQRNRRRQHSHGGIRYRLLSADSRNGGEGDHQVQEGQSAHHQRSVLCRGASLRCPRSAAEQGLDRVP